MMVLDGSMLRAPGVNRLMYGSNGAKMPWQKTPKLNSDEACKRE